MSRDVTAIFVDNYDAFTFNLVETFERLGVRVRVFRNHTAASRILDEARARPDSVIVISPGPGSPEAAGSIVEVIRAARGVVPLLGVCLGHQAILHEAGVPIVRAPSPVHGKSSMIEHDGAGPFVGLPSPLRVGRYHSLGARLAPDRFRVHASHDGMLMSVSDPIAMQVGLQFHPESILTPQGDIIARNVVASLLDGKGPA